MSTYTTDEQPLRSQRSLRLSLRFLGRLDPLGIAGLIVLVLLIGMALFAPWIAPYDPLSQALKSAVKGPSQAHLFGTDNLGRDVLSRVIYGARTSLYVGFASVAAGTILGTCLGIVSGYVGGWLDTVVQRVLDGLMAFPTLILALVVVVIIGPGLNNTVLAIAIIETPRLNRIVRSSVLALKEQSYVEAAGVVGCGPWRIMFRHILPNAAAPVIVYGSVTLASAIIIEASLSFLGLGTPPPTASWGSMLAAQGRQYLIAGPWMAIFPAAAISVAVLAINLLGDSLRDAWDPRLRHR